MAEMAMATIGSIFGGTAAAAGTTGAAVAGGAGLGGTAAGIGAATSGITASSILQGAAGLLGMFSAISAGNAEGDALDLAAEDAAREKPLETLQGISRRTSIKAAMMEQIGQQDVAYAASGTDLTFGTPVQARKEAFRQGDLGITTAVGTEQTRIARLDEREANYRKMADKARAGGWLKAAFSGFDTASSIAGRI